jgi:hypothetical protein
MKDTGTQTKISAVKDDRDINPAKISKAKPATMKALFDTIIV